MRLATEVADDIGPFARRGERDRAGPLADGEALDGAERDRLAGEPAAERLVERRADLARSSDLQVTQTRTVAAGPMSTFIEGSSGGVSEGLRSIEASPEFPANSDKNREFDAYCSNAEKIVRKR